MFPKISLKGHPTLKIWAPFSTYPCRNSYKDTIANLKIGVKTRVIFQGFTGKQATVNAIESISYGTKIVGGVTPGRNGEHLGLPVLPSVRKAMEQLKPDATGIYVAAHQAPAAIEEAIEAEVPLIVAVAEHIPLHNMMRIHSILKGQSRSRLVGANSPGIISAIGKCRIGFQPLPCFMSGCVGIVAKSGTLSYEAAASTTRAGLGQSICVGMGGDVLAGTDFVDALDVFEKDDDTEGILLIGEIGGAAELEAAEWIKNYRKREKNPKPIAALIGGIWTVPGRVMGHAGAFTLPGEPSALDKIRSLQQAGCIIVNHPSKFGERMKFALENIYRRKHGSSDLKQHQRRGVHTLSNIRPVKAYSRMPKFSHTQTRHLHLGQEFSFRLLQKKGIDTSEYPGNDLKRLLLAVGVDRAGLSPCILASLAGAFRYQHTEVLKLHFDYRRGFKASQIPALAEYLELGASLYVSLEKLVTSLVDLFMEYEAFLLETVLVESSSGLTVIGARFEFDDAAFRSSKRQGNIHSFRHIDIEDAREVEAERAGIVYVKFAGDGNIGTLVNGAADAGGKAANFLDTGGKATSETVKKSFEIILADERVKVIFINIFGGLTLGDMIANGVLLAFRELDMRIPVVVRIRGTNEAEGQKIISESGLPLHAFDDFEEAALKAIKLANEA